MQQQAVHPPRAVASQTIPEQFPAPGAAAASGDVQAAVARNRALAGSLSPQEFQDANRQESGE